MVSFALYTIGCILMLTLATSGYLWVLCLSAFLISLGLSILTTIELQILRPEEVNTSLPTIVISFICFGAYASALTAVGDKTHFMNRDDPLWSYLSIAISMVLSIIALLLAATPIRKCCACNVMADG